ncbi:hypothetical protein ACAF76_001930 [Brevibacillus sp. TJ4]
MKKIQALSNHFFAQVSSLNLKGLLKGSVIYEPIPPQMREEQAKKESAK